jgi:hypothetical protein
MQDWQQIIDSADKTEALFQHFLPFVQTEKCREILREMMSKVLEVSIEQEHTQRDQTSGECYLNLVLPYAEDGEVMENEEPSDLKCFSPFKYKAAPGVPDSYVRVARIHNRIDLVSRGYDIPFVWWGLEDSGEIREAVSHDADFVRGATDKSFVDRLRKAGLNTNDIICPINALENWYILNPLVTSPSGEPALSYLSHADGSVREPARPDLPHAAMLLRLLAKEYVTHPDSWITR